MRIAIDANILGENKGGVERYVREIVTRLPALLPCHNFFIIVNKKYGSSLSNNYNVRYIPLLFSDPLIQKSLLLPFVLKKNRIDIFHSQRVLPFFIGCKCIVSIHDILPLSNPENHRGARNEIIRRLTPRSAEKAIKILTVSNAAKYEIVDKLKVPASKVHTVYNGIDHGKEYNEKRSFKQGVYGKFIFYSGAIEPRKNLLNLIKGFKLVTDKFTGPLKLVIAGPDRDQKYGHKLRMLIKNEGIDDRVIFVGYVSEDTLDNLYKDAELFIAPSIGEGFDLPPLEALSRGTPVICSDISVHREIIKEAAYFFCPHSPEELCDKVILCLTDIKRKHEMQQKGILISKEYTWEKTVCRTAEIYEEVGLIKD